MVTGCLRSDVYYGELGLLWVYDLCSDNSLSLSISVPINDQLNLTANEGSPLFIVPLFTLNMRYLSLLSISLLNRLISIKAVPVTIHWYPGYSICCSFYVNKFLCHFDGSHFMSADTTKAVILSITTGLLTYSEHFQALFSIVLEELPSLCTIHVWSPTYTTCASPFSKYHTFLPGQGMGSTLLWHIFIYIP